MLLVKTYIAPSETHGIGLFAAEPIPKGTLIWRHDIDFDRTYAPCYLERCPPQAREFLYYYGWINKDTGQVHCSLDNERFCNHSSTPNTLTNESVYTMTASRDIAAGEEITCDYRTFDLESIDNPPDYI